VGFTTTGRTGKHDVGLLKLHIGVFGTKPDSLVVVVHTDRDNPLGAFLTDDVLVKQLEHVAWGCRLLVRLNNRLIVGNDLLTPANTFVTDEDLGRSCD